jgi:MOSC domain-containing protein YiiM
MVERIAVQAIANRGFEGCVHGRPGSRRQVLLVEGEMLRELGLSPGVVRENITTEGIRLGELESGRRLRIGGAVLEVTVPCEPCDKMDAIRPGLQDELQGRRGTLCRVIENGLIRRGDALDVIELAAARNEESKGGA